MSNQKNRIKVVVSYFESLSKTLLPACLPSCQAEAGMRRLEALEG